MALADISNTLIVAATAEEAADVPENYRVLICGIGKVNAAIAVSTALATWPDANRPPTVVNIGTAGALHECISGIVVPTSVIDHDVRADELAKMGFPVANSIILKPGPAGRVLATGDTFVTDAATRSRLAIKADMVDMEAFAIASTCQRFGARCTIVKHISDNADISALEWADAISCSSRELGSWIRSNL